MGGIEKEFAVELGCVIHCVMFCNCVSVVECVEYRRMSVDFRGYVSFLVLCNCGT